LSHIAYIPVESRMETPLDAQSSDLLTKDYPIESSESRKPIDIPPELLYPILEEVVSSYLDFAITEPRETSVQLSREDNGGGEQTAGPDAEGGANDLQDAADKLPDNIVVSLLSVSYLFRDITLKILSGAFGIDRTVNGVCVQLSKVTNLHAYVFDYHFDSLSQNPWTLLKTSRRMYHLARTCKLRQEHVTTATNIISKSPLLIIYFYITVYAGFSRSLYSDVECLPPGTPYAFDALDGYANATGIAHFMKRPILFRRVLERLQYFMSSFNVGEIFPFILNFCAMVQYEYP
jgi:hypothetical protein